MNGNLPDWLARLLGVEPAGAGQGTDFVLHHEWNWPPAVTLLVLLGLGALFVVLYLREAGRASRIQRLSLASMRVFLVVVLLVMLAQIGLTVHRTGLPYLAVIIDDSASMSTADYYEPDQRDRLLKRLNDADVDGLTRLGLAQAALLEDNAHLLKELSDRYRLKVYRASEDALPLDGEDADTFTEQIRQLSADGLQTQLGKAITRVVGDLRGSPPAAVVLLSDGINTQGQSLPEAASVHLARRRIPLYIVAMASEHAAGDLKLEDPLYDDVVFKDDIVNIDVKLSGPGFGGRNVNVKLIDPSSQEIKAQSPTTVAADGASRTIRVSWRPSEIGTHELELVVDPQVEEEQAGRTDNNRLPVVITVRDDKIRVLYVQDAPSFEYRFIKNLLTRDETIDFKTVLQQADPEFYSIDKTSLRLFPVRREELFEYHVLMLGDVDPSLLSRSQLEAIHDFVTQRGGGLAVMCGERYMPQAYRDTPLADLLPIDLDRAQPLPADQNISRGFRPQLTRIGLDSPQMQLGDSLSETRRVWDEVLAELYWYVQAPVMRGGAQVLLEHPSQFGENSQPLPIIAMQYVGAGKVVMHMTNESWRWRRQVRDVYFARYWVQTVRFLARNRLLSDQQSTRLTTLRESYDLGQPVEFRLRVMDESSDLAAASEAEVLIESQQQENRRVTLAPLPGGRGIFEGAADGLPAGRYHAILSRPASPGAPLSVDFRVEPPAAETQQLQPDLSELRTAAERTRGAVLNIFNSDQLLDYLPRGAPVRTEPLPPVPLWNSPYLIILILALLVSEWLLRKRFGML